MSIKLSDSPFRNLEKPCRFARESMNCIVCSCKEAETTSCHLYHQDNCEWYNEVDERLFVDNRKNGCRTYWKKIITSTPHYSTYRYACSHCGEDPPLTTYKQEWLSEYCPACGRYMYGQEEPVIDVPTGVYQHFKGKYYEVLGTAEHSESSEKLVVYKALYGEFKMYVRPLSMFIEEIEDVKYNYRGPRFYPMDGIIYEGLRKDDQERS